MRYAIVARWVFKRHVPLEDQLAVANMLVGHYFDPHRMEAQLAAAQKKLLNADASQEDIRQLWREVQFLRYNQAILTLDYDPPLNGGGSRSYKSLYFESLEDMHRILSAQQKGGTPLLPTLKVHHPSPALKPLRRPKVPPARQPRPHDTAAQQPDNQPRPFLVRLWQRVIGALDWLFHNPGPFLAGGLLTIIIVSGISDLISREYTAYQNSLDHQAIEMRAKLDLYKPGWLPEHIPMNEYRESSADWQLHRLYSGENHYLILSQYGAQPEYDTSHSAAWSSDSKAQPIDLGEQDAMMLKKGNRILLNLEIGTTGITIDTDLPEEDAIHVAASLTLGR